MSYFQIVALMHNTAFNILGCGFWHTYAKMSLSSVN